MPNDQRSYEASTLRSFFDEQLRHLHDMLHHKDYQPDINSQADLVDTQTIESFIDASNSKMRAVSGYADKLRIHIQTLYRHTLQIADEIPPSMSLAPDAFRNNPTVNSLFVSSQDIDILFKTSADINTYLHQQSAVSVVYALLTAHKNEKKTLGFGLMGDMLIRDIPQRVINFSLHDVHAPCDSENQLDIELKKHLFDRITQLIKCDMAGKMNSQLLANASYEMRIKSLANPEVYLKSLIEYLQTPNKLISLEKTHYKLNKLGIVLNEEDQGTANEFDIHELIWMNDSRNLLMRVFYPMIE